MLEALKIQITDSAVKPALASISVLCSIAKAQMASDNENIEMEEDTEGFQPVKRRKRNPEIENMFHRDQTEKPMERPSEKLKNRYSPLENLKENENNAGKTNNHSIQKPKIPPPIVIHENLKDHKKFIQFIGTHAGKNYHLKYSAKRVAIQTYDSPTYKKLLNVLTTEEIAFHTYTPHNEKTKGFVIRGLDCCPSIDEIKENMQEKHNITPKEIYKMKTQQRPLYLVITSKDIDLKHLQDNVKFVCNTRIYWERHESNKITTQCRRCLEWGHAASNCFAEPSCAHCAGGHWTHLCDNKKNIKCRNCGQEDHKAYSTECPAYCARVAYIQNSDKKLPEKRTYVNAPAPRQNAWTQNRKTVNMNKEDEFPALPKPKQMQPTTAVNPVVSRPDCGNLASFQNLTNEIKRLNSLINVEKMFKLIQNLNNQLTQATNNIEKFMITQTFLSNLTDDDF